LKFPQVAGVVIEDDVETGANTMVDRGSLGVTRIASGAKIDNLVQIADNVRIGRGVVIAAQRRERRRHRLQGRGTAGQDRPPRGGLLGRSGSAGSRK